MISMDIKIQTLISPCVSQLRRREWEGGTNNHKCIRNMLWKRSTVLPLPFPRLKVVFSLWGKAHLGWWGLALDPSFSALFALLIEADFLGLWRWWSGLQGCGEDTFLRWPVVCEVKGWGERKNNDKHNGKETEPNGTTNGFSSMLLIISSQHMIDCSKYI